MDNEDAFGSPFTEEDEKRFAEMEANWDETFAEMEANWDEQIAQLQAGEWPAIP